MASAALHAPFRSRALRVAAAGCASVALCATTAAPVMADGEATTGAGAAKPTIVLVHGAFADASSWTGVVQRLEKQGYTVMAPANPLRGLYSDAAYIASVLKSVKGPIVLAGHSYAGAVISTAAAGNSQVKALVYINALMPDVGESGMSLSARFPSALGTATDSVPYRTATASGTDLYLKRDKVHSVFANCLPENDANIIGVEQRPAATTAFSETAKVAAWKDIPSWALVGSQDMTISPVQERFQAQRAHAHTEEIDSCHLALIAQPDKVASLITQATTATVKASTPQMAATGSSVTTKQAAALGGLSAALLAAGIGALLQGRRSGRRSG